MTTKDEIYEPCGADEPVVGQVWRNDISGVEWTVVWLDRRERLASLVRERPDGGVSRKRESFGYLATGYTLTFGAQR